MPGQPDRAGDVPAGSQQAELAAFCVVANIADQTAHGEGGLELQRGVKHFPPADITRQGHRYYLAHPNAHRVIYSRRPPPAEPPNGS